MNTLLSTAYWPNLAWCCCFFNSEVSMIEQHENYSRQTFRNRTEILSANGVLALSIPVRKTAHKIKVRDAVISYESNWQAQHWTAIKSAYGKSAYFKYFEDEIRPLYIEKTDSLLEFNMKQLKALFSILRIERKILLSDTYEKIHEGFEDFRGDLSSGNKMKNAGNCDVITGKHYFQVFGDRHGFIKNLSILDLIFNSGLDVYGILPAKQIMHVSKSGVCLQKSDA